MENESRGPGEGGETARAPQRGLLNTGDLYVMVVMKTVTNSSGNDGPWRDAHWASSYK